VLLKGPPHNIHLFFGAAVRPVIKRQQFARF
jgi:hypothetical protein